MNHTYDYSFMPKTKSQNASQILLKYNYKLDNDDTASVSSKYPWPEDVKYGLKVGYIHAYPTAKGGMPVLYSDKSML